MWQSAASFFAGYACRSQCGNIPCKGRLKNSQRPFKLSIYVHCATIEAIDGPSMLKDQRPYIAVRVGDKTKETEHGDWSRERGQWCFREVITMEVVPHDDVLVELSCSTTYDLWLASLSLSSRRLGEAGFPVCAVLPRLKPEDRDTDGIVYATPVIPFDARHEGRPVARVYLSFESNQAPPPTTKFKGMDQCSTNCNHWCGTIQTSPTKSQVTASLESQSPCEFTSPYAVSGLGSDASTGWRKDALWSSDQGWRLTKEVPHASH